MSSRARGVVSVLIGLVAAGVLPVYPRRCMTRSSMVGGGDRISWGWKLERLPTFLKSLRYMRPEEHATANLIANLVLALALGAGFAIATWMVSRRLHGSK